MFLLATKNYYVTDFHAREKRSKKDTYLSAITVRSGNKVGSNVRR